MCVCVRVCVSTRIRVWVCVADVGWGEGGDDGGEWRAITFTVYIYSRRRRQSCTLSRIMSIILIHTHGGERFERFAGVTRDTHTHKDMT